MIHAVIPSGSASAARAPKPTAEPSPVSQRDLLDDEHLEALDAADQEQVDQLRASAQIAAAQTFGPFNDAPDSPFYSADDLSPAQTWERIAEHVGLATILAVAHGIAQRPITTDAIRRLHKIIFASTFPEHAGHLRKPKEEGRYGIVLGTAEHAIVKSERATAGARVPRRLEQICREFNETAAAQEQPDAIHLNDLVLTAVRFYVKILSTHPFLDGNGRTAFTTPRRRLRSRCSSTRRSTAMTDPKAPTWRPMASSCR
jgi:fido (protein-threonine AMPylation protein)